VKNRAPAFDALLVRMMFLLLVLIAPFASSQVSTANITGAVQDFTNANIRDAAVRLINVQTGAENDSKTNSEGRFFLPGVIAGTYTLQIERAGFATTQLNGIILNIGDTKSLLIRLKVGSVSESVNVDASGITLDSTDAAVSTLVDRKFVNNIPMNGRSFQDLISMTPGIVTPSPQSAARGSGVEGDFSVNGQRLDSNSFYVDGVSANINSGLSSGASRLTISGSSGGSTALGTTQSLVSIDALQEFRVLSSTYSAEYGRTPGGQFTFLTRSGTDTIHGSLYTYWRDYVVDGTDWFTAAISPISPPNPPRFSQNDFGGTLGAPIAFPGSYDGHDKTFVFLSYEGLLLTQPTPITYNYVPSSAVFKEAPVPLQNVLTYFPYGGPEINDASGQPTGLAASILSSNSLPARVDSTSFRVDHTISPKHAVFLRYGDTPSHSQSEQLSSLTSSIVRTKAFTLGATSQLSTKTSNDLRLGFTRSTSSGYTTPDPFGLCNQFPLSTFNGAIGLPDPCGPARADVFIHIAGVGDSEADSDNLSGSLHEWNLRDSFSLESSRHGIKFGFDQRHLASTLTPAPLSVEADFFSRQSMVENLASDIVITKSVPANPVLNQFSAFVQDEWRASQALTLSLGLRWEVSPPPTGKHGRDAYTASGDINSPGTLTISPRGTPLWHTSWYNFAPRLGAAWRIDDEPGREMVLRAGAGVFFDSQNRPGLRAFSGMGFNATSYLSNVPAPITQAQIAFSSTAVPLSTNSLVFDFASHLQLPYSAQWNVGLEKTLGKNQALTMTYVGAHGVRLLQEQRRNISEFNPHFADVSFFPGGITSNYQALQTKFQRSVARGVQALASYTWAHSLDYGSTDPLYPLVYGNSDLDVRHNLEGAVSWDLPKAGKNPLLRYVLGSWGVDGRIIARTAFPVTLLGNLLSDPATGERYYNGVDLLPGRQPYLSGSEFPGGRMINGGPNTTTPAFTLPDGTSPGNAPRNSVRGFNAVQTNLSLRRDMPIYYDRVHLQFRVESFNLLNHPNFGYIDPSLSDALFGQATKMLNQSFGPSGSLYQQGGPRSVQFSFRIVF
jgi:hypothetical protein